MLAEQIEDLAALVVLAEVDDPASLRELSECLRAVLARTELPAEARAPAQQALSLGERLCAGAGAEAEDTLRQLRHVASRIQRAALAAARSARSESGLPVAHGSPAPQGAAAPTLRVGAAPLTPSLPLLQPPREGQARGSAGPPELPPGGAQRRRLTLPPGVDDALFEEFLSL